MTLSNNLKGVAAIPAFVAPANPTTTFISTIAPVFISSHTASVTMGSTTTIVGTDSGAANGLYAEGQHDQYGNETSGTDGECLAGDGTTVRATVSAGALNQMTGTQVFTITPSSVGTCTFSIADQLTGTVGGVANSNDNGNGLITVTILGLP